MSLSYTITCPTCHEVRTRLFQTPGAAARYNRVCRACAQVGHKTSPEARAKMAAAVRPPVWNTGVPCAPAHAQAIREGNTGKKRTAEQKTRLSLGQHKRHGTTPNPDKPTRRQLGDWAYEVIKRDQGACVCCGVKKTTPKSINAHHILSRSKHPAFALSLDNGVTLCVDCHTTEHSINGII